MGPCFYTIISIQFPCFYSKRKKNSENKIPPGTIIILDLMECIGNPGNQKLFKIRFSVLKEFEPHNFERKESNKNYAT